MLGSLDPDKYKALAGKYHDKKISKNLNLPLMYTKCILNAKCYISIVYSHTVSHC